MAEEIPSITRINRKILAGVEVETDYLEVKSTDIEKCKEIYDKIRKEE